MRAMRQWGSRTWRASLAFATALLLAGTAIAQDAAPATAAAGDTDAAAPASGTCTFDVRDQPLDRVLKYVLDASGAVLGRLASKAAMMLMGKHKPTYTPFLDMGDHVVIINADKVKLTGRKEDDKLYRTHSGYPGGLREIQARKMRQRRPERMLELAIQGMLPKSKLGKHMYRKLNVYAGPKHPHQAQKPVDMAV